MKYDFNDLRVYHSPLKEGDEISIDYPSYTKRHNENGYTLFSLNDYTDKITIRVNKSSDDTLYIYGFYFDSGDAGVVYNAIGVNSAEARHYINTNNDAILKTLHLDPKFKVKAYSVVISHSDEDNERLKDPKFRELLLHEFVNACKDRDIDMDEISYIIPEHTNTDNIHYHMLMLVNNFAGKRINTQYLGKRMDAGATAKLSPN